MLQLQQHLESNWSDQIYSCVSFFFCNQFYNLYLYYCHMDLYVANLSLSLSVEIMLSYIFMLLSFICHIYNILWNHLGKAI